MTRALVILVATGVATVATTATLAARRPEASVNHAQEQERSGPDSARVGRFLDALGAADPVVCELISDQVGNFWWSDHGYGIGRLSDQRVAQRAAKDSIGRHITDPAAIRLLSGRLAADDPCVRHTAAKMLGNSAVTDDALTRLFDNGLARVREAALRAAGERERPALRPRIEGMLGEREPGVVAMAVWALGEYEQKASVPAVRRVLSHQSAQVRVNAAWALGEIEDAGSVDELEGMVTRDNDRRVRHAAIDALGQLSQRRSLDVLVRVVEGSDLELATAAAEAISNLDDITTAPAGLVRALESPHVPLRHAALNALSEIEDPALVPAFLRHVGDPDPEVRVAVIEALGELRARAAIPALKRALNDTNSEVRRAAIDALAEIDDQ